VEVSVRDTGIGVEPELLSHIFDLFTQAPSGLHRTKGGLGLGLSLVRNLVQMHGGSVEAFSAGAGKGTEMVMTLPRLRAGRRGSPGKKRKETEAAGPPAQRRILVVDDEPDTAGALAELLGLKGHIARAVPDGASALALVQTFDPEIVLLDLGLPGMDGYQVASKLREMLGQRVMLVALTGYQDDPVRLREAGFDAHLLKPTSLEKLFTLVSELDRKREGASPTPDGSA
jgi:two-component system CheB/CheR fusion protein